MDGYCFNHNSFILFNLKGPRLSLNPIKIFAGSFGGSVLYSNPNYVSPNLVSFF